MSELDAVTDVIEFIGLISGKGFEANTTIIFSKRDYSQHEKDMFNLGAQVATRLITKVIRNIPLSNAEKARILEALIKEIGNAANPSIDRILAREQQRDMDTSNRGSSGPTPPADPDRPLARDSASSEGTVPSQSDAEKLAAAFGLKHD